MFQRVLIANRGEIAVRIARACRELGVETVSVYSQADADALHVQLATRAVCIGPAKAADSYLNVNALLTVAKETGCDAVHPGYGFLSESAEFSDKCAEMGLRFIGPSGDVIRMMGNKSAARDLMKKHHVPVVPGSDGAVETAEEAGKVAAEIGYPVLVKASAGGGGRGMRRVDSPEEMESKFQQARAEALACFGDGQLYVEKLILNPKHIEFQILADRQGNVIHLGERDCSIQRKNQKLVEESPSKALTPELREAMGQAAVAAAKAAGYENAGTIEFVLDQEGHFYFLEMNTRIQVEHPVTEMVTGLDLVREQLRIAAGLPLSVSQEDVVLRGHALECRINAEDAAQDFRPCPGTTKFLHFPGGPDSLVAKVIVHAPTRLEAIRRMRRVLEEMIIEGYPTTADFCHLILHHPDFVKGRYDTGFLAQHQDELLSWNKED